MRENTVIPYEGFTIVYKEIGYGSFQFIILDDKGDRAWPHKTFTDLKDAQEEIMIYVRSSLQYIPKSFTEWITKTTGHEWAYIKINADEKRRAWYYKQYAAYCAANSLPVHYNFEF